MSMQRIILPAASALVVALALSGCAAGQGSPAESADPPTPTAEAQSPAPFDDDDVMFAQMMIPHHEQAVEMSDLVLAKDGIDPQVRELAEQVKAAQQPEIDRMRAWLAEWGAEELGELGGDHAAHGMMSGDDLGALEDADGTEASRLFLEQMIVHHEGAISMAEFEAERGTHPDAVRMAERIVETQAQEIELMRELLGGA
jgi:uncharacterized protein (DUF305 family)